MRQSNAHPISFPNR